MSPEISDAQPEYSKPTIGIAGGIAAGKSLVAKIFEQLGGRTIDSDDLVHRELALPEVIERYRAWWGDRICNSDGTIDRNAVANIIFNDPDQHARMEAFLYPRLEDRRRALTEEYRGDSDVVAIVLASPLLYEVGLDKVCDVVVFVDADRNLRLARARRNRGWSEQEFQRRENLQKPLDKKRDAADHKVVNNSTTDALRSQVTSLFHRLTARPS